MYITSLVLSLFSLIMAIFIMDADVDSQLLRYFGDTELYLCMGVSIVFLVIGIIQDNGKRYK